MITEQDLREAIAECEGTPKPNANTCIKLAAYYTILENMKADAVRPLASAVQSPGYSYSASGSEFSKAVQVKGADKVLPIIDELMDALMVLNPGLYHSVLRKISDL